ncbi:hypothetical protein ES703_35185 [subsurface metagenome]
MNGDEVRKERLFVKEEFVKWAAEAFAEAQKKYIDKIEWLEARELNLGTARNGKAVDGIPPMGYESGNYIKVVSLEGKATLMLDTLGSQEFDLTKVTEYKQLFHQVFVSNAAQTGKKLVLILGRGDFSFPESPEKGGGGKALVCTNVHLPYTERLLQSNAYYRSDWFDVLNYSRVTLLSYSTVASAANGVEIQQSMDGEHADYSTRKTAEAGVGLPLTVELVARYVRIVYHNGPASQNIPGGEFRLTALARSMP